MNDISIEFLPLAMANPLAEMTKRAEAADAKLALAECVLHDYGIYVEGLALANQVKALADRVVALEAEIKRRNAAENRMFDGLEQLTNGDEPLYSSEVWYEW